MPIEPVDITTNHGSYIGDPAPVAFGKINDNFAFHSAEIQALRASASRTNLLINPSGLLNQRVFAGGALASNAFGYDRWYAGAGGANVTVAAGVFNHTSGMICQAIESPQNTLGTTVTVSVSDLSGGNLNVTAGGVAGVIEPGAGRRFVNILVPASTAGGHLRVTLAGTALTYRDVMAVRADWPGLFDARLPGLELLLSQRYCEKSYDLAVKPGAVSSFGRVSQFFDRAPGDTTFGNLRFMVPKFAVPSIFLYASETGTVGKTSGSNGTDSVSTNLGSVGVAGCQISSLNAPGNFGMSYHYLAEAELR